MGEQVARLMEQHLCALARVIEVAAEAGSDAAVEFVGDYLNSQDAVVDEDERRFDIWSAAHHPLSREALEVVARHVREAVSAPVLSGQPEADR